MDNQFRKKPVVIEAVQWPGNKFDSTPPQWFQDAMYRTPGAPGFLMRWGDEIIIDTLEGQMRAAPGDWIIQGIKGEIYPCKPDIFEATYERAITAGTPAKGGIDADAAFWTKAEAWANAQPGKDGLKAGDALSAYIETYAAALAERAASNPASPTTGAKLHTSEAAPVVPASPAPVAAIKTWHERFIEQHPGEEIEHCNPYTGAALMEAEIRDLRAALSSAPMAQAEPRPTDDELWDQTLRERDTYHEWADKLADAIATYFAVDIGEHSNQNCPWAEAFEAIEAATPAVPAAPSDREGD